MKTIEVNTPDAGFRGVNKWLMTNFIYLSKTLAEVLGWLIYRPKLKPVPVRKGS